MAHGPELTPVDCGPTENRKEDEMSELEVVTNWHKRDLIYGFELTENERQEFDYYNDDEIQDQTFFRYKGELYDLGEFMRIDKNAPSAFQNFDGYSSDSFFSGILVKYPKEEWGDYDTEHIIVAWYYC